MPIEFSSARCARPGCTRPPWGDDLCARCWRLARWIGKPPAQFAKEPLIDGRLVSWDDLSAEAARRGLSLPDLFADGSPPRPHD